LALQFFSANQLAGMLQQQFKDAKRLLLKSYSQPMFAQLPASQIYFEGAKAYDALHWGGFHNDGPLSRKCGIVYHTDEVTDTGSRHSGL